jgi:hypothetical protein
MPLNADSGGTRDGRDFTSRVGFAITRVLHPERKVGTSSQHSFPDLKATVVWADQQVEDVGFPESALNGGPCGYRQGHYLQASTIVSRPPVDDRVSGFVATHEWQAGHENMR